MGQGQGQRGGTADHGPFRVVLAAVAGTDELVLAAVPGDHATEMGADRVEADGADGALPFDDQIGGISLEALHQAAVAFGVAGQPAAGHDRNAEVVEGNGTTR